MAADDAAPDVTCMNNIQFNTALNRFLSHELFMSSKCRSIIRSSINIFFKHYIYFSSLTNILLLIPPSSSILLSHSLSTSTTTLLPYLQSRIESVFREAEFPASKFSSLLYTKLSQTASTFLITLPFTLSFLLLAKATVLSRVIQFLDIFPTCKNMDGVNVAKLFLKSILPLWKRLIFTQIFSSLFVFATNAVAFSFFIFLFNSLDALGLNSHNNLVLMIFTVCTMVAYSVVLANTIIACNLSVIVAGAENCSGFKALRRAIDLIKKETGTVLSIALPTNLCLAFVEFLFHYRVVKAYKANGSSLDLAVIGEGMLLAYMYSVVILVDTIIYCVYYQRRVLQLDSSLY